MKNRIAVILMALTALTFSSCDKPEVPSAFLEVTPNNIAGTWVLESFCGVPQAEGNYVYLEILRKDRTFKIFQNTDSAYTRVLRAVIISIPITRPALLSEACTTISRDIGLLDTLSRT